MPVAARVKFRLPASNPFEAEVHDLSETGFRMVSYAHPPIGTRILVWLPGLQSLEAIVRRVSGNDVGCEFMRPLHPAVAAHVQTRLGR